LFTEDTLKKVANGQGLTDRKVFLFDELLILCKPNTRDNVATDIVTLDDHSTHQREFRLEEKFFIRKVDVIDRKNTEGKKCLFKFYCHIVLNFRAMQMHNIYLQS